MLSKLTMKWGGVAGIYPQELYIMKVDYTETRKYIKGTFKFHIFIQNGI